MSGIHHLYRMPSTSNVGGFTRLALIRISSILAMLTITVLSVLILGCGTYFKSYQNPLLQSSPPKEVIQLPIFTTLLQPSQSDSVDKSIVDKLAGTNPTMTFKNFEETKELFQRKNQADRWFYFANNITMDDGQPNSKVLQELGDTLGVDAVLWGVFSNVYEKPNRLIRPISPTDVFRVYSKGTRSKVTLTYRIYDTKAGVVLWEMSCESSVASNDDPLALENAAGAAVRKILGNIRQIK